MGEGFDACYERQWQLKLVVHQSLEGSEKAKGLSQPLSGFLGLLGFAWLTRRQKLVFMTRCNFLLCFKAFTLLLLLLLLLCQRGGAFAPSSIIPPVASAHFVVGPARLPCPLLASKKDREKYDALGTMFSGLVSSVVGASAVSGPKVAMDLDLAKTWAGVNKALSSNQTRDEASFRADVDAGLVSSPLCKIRLFGGDEEKDVRVTFYRDSASWW